MCLHAQQDMSNGPRARLAELCRSASHLLRFELPAYMRRHAQKEPGLSTPSKCRDASRSASSSQRDADKARARLERAQADAAAAESAWRASQEEVRSASETLQTAMQTERCSVRLCFDFLLKKSHSVTICESKCVELPCRQLSRR